MSFPSSFITPDTAPATLFGNAGGGDLAVANGVTTSLAFDSAAVGLEYGTLNITGTLVSGTDGSGSIPGQIIRCRTLNLLSATSIIRAALRGTGGAGGTAVVTSAVGVAGSTTTNPGAQMGFQTFSNGGAGGGDAVHAGGAGAGISGGNGGGVNYRALAVGSGTGGTTAAGANATGGGTVTRVAAFDSILPIPGAPGCGGGSGARNLDGTSGVGGAGGQGGNILVLQAQTISAYPGSRICSDGSNGANGGDGSGTTTGTAAGGGGGAGGNAGPVMARFQKLIQSGPVWAATTAYNIGDAVWPTVAQTNPAFATALVCTVAGTSAGSEPAASTVDQATVVDGGVTWKYQRLFSARFGTGGTGGNGHSLGSASATYAGGNGASGYGSLIAAERVG